MKAVADGLKCHPYSVLLKVLDYAQKEDIVLLKKEIGYYILNKAIKVFEELWNQPLGFDMYSYDIKNVSERKRLEEEWAVYYGKLSEKVDLLDTPVEALMRQEKETVGERDESKKSNKTELGDAGEQYVYEYEKRRVGEFNPRLAKN